MSQYATLNKSTLDIPKNAKITIKKVGRTDGYDGHCLRAYSYFGEQMPDIDGSSVTSINSISSRYPKLRQDSKAPTFALTYQGTSHTLMKNCGFDKETAERIENQYHSLYKVSDDWVAEKLREGQEKGYIELAFGLKLRTPLMSNTVLNSPYTPHKAQAEARTAGNALIQSYGLLTNRASNAFMEKVWESPHKYSIRQVAQIHDAAYFLVHKDPEVLQFLNTHLIKEMQWQELEAIQHDQVKLDAELEIFYPDWSNPIPVRNDADLLEISKILDNLGTTNDRQEHHQN